MLLFLPATGVRLIAGVPARGGTGGAAFPGLPNTGVPMSVLFPGRVLTLRWNWGVDELEVLEDWGVELAVVDRVWFLSQTNIGSLAVYKVTGFPSMSSSSMYRGVLTK